MNFPWRRGRFRKSMLIFCWVEEPMSTPIHLFVSAAVLFAAAALPATASDRVKTVNGIVESTAAPKGGVRVLRGLPFGHPPVGPLRWREPQPVKNWSGARNA